jgi:hypothetical protein
MRAVTSSMIGTVDAARYRAITNVIAYRADVRHAADGVTRC